MNNKIPVPAKQRKYVYHLTTQTALKDIRINGIIPYGKSSRFSPLSPEAHDNKRKIFLLPVLNKAGMNGFLDEWWHNEQPIILRILFNKIKNPLESETVSYRSQEIWTHCKINPFDIEIGSKRECGKYKWCKL